MGEVYSQVMLGASDDELGTLCYRLKSLDNSMLTGPLLVSFAQELIYKHAKGTIPPVIQSLEKATAVLARKNKDDLF
jgi:hypothetical protein